MLKKVYAYVLAVMMTVSLLSVSAYAENTVSTPEDQCLVYTNYEEVRKNVYYGTESATLTSLTPIEVEHAAYIDNWKNNLGIQILNVDAEITSIGQSADIVSTAKTEVYEWVTIDYMFLSEGITRTMEFGTNHIIEVNAAGNILSDTYCEITGFETGTAEDLQVLRARQNDDFSSVSDFVPTATADEAAVQAAAAYNYSAAVNYAHTGCSSTYFNSGMHPSGYNPAYYYIPGADCCNFISQCIRAGGKVMTSTWRADTVSSTTALSDPSCAHSSPAWRYTPIFQSYCVSMGFVPVHITSVSQAGAGNPIYWLASDGNSTNHVMIIVGAMTNDNVVFVDAHNSDCRNYPRRLSDNIFYTLWF